MYTTYNTVTNVISHCRRRHLFLVFILLTGILMDDNGDDEKMRMHSCLGLVQPSLL